MQAISARARIAIVVSILLVSVGCDQATKRIAITKLKPLDRVEVIGDYVTLQYAENRGAFLSLGATLPDGARFWIFTVFTSAVLLLLAWYVFSQSGLSKSDIVAIALLLSGGVGNMIDRISRNGIVVDFMVIDIWGPIRTGVFNVADVAVMAGVFLLFGARLFTRPKQEEAAHETGNP
ncbi:MAG TPA: signal peptidase II [Candidatus Hydrogenedentes bacterium]|nr:signal peptidase II [Candidatus Hydrogenedentota bacterium]HRK33458.1 signal peptidase II [Candidatus Hydrogenedentota bacterium]